MAASLLSFKLGLEMLKSIAPLCTNINKVDAFTGESSQDLLLFHLINTLEFCSKTLKTDKYGYFEVFIEYLKQSNHGTYRELRKGIPQKTSKKSSKLLRLLIVTVYLCKNRNTLLRTSSMKIKFFNNISQDFPVSKISSMRCSIGASSARSYLPSPFIAKKELRPNRINRRTHTKI